MVGFWGLNIGLMGMIVVTLVPIGVHAGARELRATASGRRGRWSSTSSRWLSGCSGCA